MEPKPREERDMLAASADLGKRRVFADRIGNHRVDGYRLKRAAVRTASKYYQERGLINLPKRYAALPASPPAWRGIPTTGTVNIFALLIEFDDHTHTVVAGAIHDALFGDPTFGTPYESLAAYYERASYNQRHLSGGTTFGWYQAGQDRSAVATNQAGREALIKEAIQYFNVQGHDFSQYDNTGNGQIDYFLVFWTGPHTGWGTFWWGYQTRFSDSTFTVDGVRLGDYAWQWESSPVGAEFNPLVAIQLIFQASDC
ncbi:MAG: hypothetical protein JXA89_10670 [Anaerolineae bacterium]|nr:hypothetical protein [Anaerolineae bacterium]